MALTFYTNPQSRGRIARWMLEEIGQPYDTVVLDYATTLKGPDYAAINPMAKIPTLVDGGTVITEVAAICTYLADAFPEAGLMPTDRGPLYRWMFFGAGPLEQALVNVSLGWVAAPEKERRTGYGSLERVVTTLTGHLADRPFIAGDGFSAADIYVGSQIGWGLMFGTLPGNDILRGYWERIATRPALARAAALDDALIRKE
ncbi:MAG: glutathione S-transferase family protein [bacterium]